MGIIPITAIIDNGRPLMDEITAVISLSNLLRLLSPFASIFSLPPSPVTIMPSNQSQRQISEDERHLSTVLNVIPAAVAQSVVNILPFLSRPPPKPMCTSPLSGRNYINELLTCSNDARVHEAESVSFSLC